MKIKDIFGSAFAIELAKDLAEQQQTLPPHEIIRKLIRFGAIGAVALIVIVLAIFLIRSSVGDDANTRQVLFFASFMSVLVLISAIGATVVTLWDGFVGQYIQRLAMSDVAQEIIEVTYEIPVVDTTQPGQETEPVELTPTGTVVSIEDENFVQGGDLSVAMVAKRLEGLRCVISAEDWSECELDERWEFFNGLSRNVTVGQNLSAVGRNLFATAMPMMSCPMMIEKYGLKSQVSVMLEDLEESIEFDEEEVVDPTNQVAIG